MFAKLIDSARRDKKRAGLVLGGAVVLLLILFGIQRLVGGDSAKQRVLQQAMINLLDAQSFHTDVDFTLNLPTPVGGKQQPLVDVAVNLGGDVQRSGEGEPEFVGDMRVETSGRGIILFADGQLRLLQDAVAFRLDNLPTILNPNGNLVEQWTYVSAPVLVTENSEDVRAVLGDVLAGMNFVDDAAADGLLHFSRGFSEEEELALVEVFRQGKSGNRALHVLARLMRAYAVNSLDVWVDPDTKEVQQISAQFVQSEGEARSEVADLALAFSDFGKETVVERPPVELTVKPEVFGRIFGRGEVLELENSN